MILKQISSLLLCFLLCFSSVLVPVTYGNPIQVTDQQILNWIDELAQNSIDRERLLKIQSMNYMELKTYSEELKIKLKNTEEQLQALKSSKEETENLFSSYVEQSNKELETLSKKLNKEQKVNKALLYIAIGAMVYAAAK